MRPTTVSHTATAASTNWIPLNHHAANFGVRWLAEKSGTGDRTYSVQGTITDILAGDTAVAFDLVSGATATRDGSESVPLTAIRLTTTAGSGAASLDFTVLQNDA